MLTTEIRKIVQDELKAAQKSERVFGILTKQEISKLDPLQKFHYDMEVLENEGHYEEFTEKELLARMDPSTHFQYKIKKQNLQRLR